MDLAFNVFYFCLSFKFQQPVNTVTFISKETGIWPVPNISNAFHRTNDELTMKKSSQIWTPEF